MNLLLDTHAILWFLNGDKKISEKVKKILASPANDTFISIVSLWEIAVKLSLGKLSLKTTLNYLFRIIEKQGFHFLPITPEHIICAATLPMNHRDPFDRIIISQALTEEMTIITRDESFAGYGVKITW